MKPQILTITNGNNQLQYNHELDGLILDSRNAGKLTYDSTKSGLTLGIRQSPYKYETTGGAIYIGDFPPWEPKEWIKPWSPGPWEVPVPQVQPLSSNSYVYLNPAPASPWHVTTTNDKISLILDVPGVKPSDINVQIENMVIKVTGKRADNGWAILHTWTLLADYDPTTATAEMELGTLKLVIMKYASKQAYQVKIKVVK